MNDLLQIWPVLIAFLVLGLTFGFAFNQRRLGRQLVAQAEKHVANFKQQDDEQREDREALEAMHLEVLEILSLRCATAERRAREFQGFIVGVQGERNTWRELYFAQASGADAAQGMMMRRIERLELAYFQATGQHAPSDRAIAEVRASFTQQHGKAVEEFRADGGAARAAEQASKESEQLARIDPKEE